MSGSESQHFRAIVKKNPSAQKVLFYLTSYGFPWWSYSISIKYFQKRGYEVVVYDFDNQVIENDDPTILPQTTLALVKDMSERQAAYRLKGIEHFYGIGNSLGSFMLFNYCIRFPLEAIVINSGGSIADVMFGARGKRWKEVAARYTAKGYDHAWLREHWADIDLARLVKNVQTERVLVTYSVNDGTIPRQSTEDFIKYLRESGKTTHTETDKSPHVRSALKNSLKLRKLKRFLETGQYK